MNYGRTVLWLGITLILANLVLQWPTLRALLFTGQGNTGSSGGSSSGNWQITPLPNPQITPFFAFPGQSGGTVPAGLNPNVQAV